MPPDEYQGHISNSIYTNLIANYAVSTAKWFACLVDEGKNKFLFDTLKIGRESLICCFFSRVKK